MYKAIVCRLTNVRSHPNADRLKLATIQGYQVVVGLNVQDGDLGKRRGSLSYRAPRSVFNDKGFHFCVMEDIKKSDDTYVDVEKTA